jgi:potassium efflux system protein
VADLLLALLALVLTALVARNIPGLVEITLVRNLTADPGVRYAAACLAQYTAVALGVVWIAQILALDWSRLGWILAALSVGLGFGLQEIVANFVCGLVLLFERPIRVGDVVTVGTVTGTVSKIRIRATTITDWDRKEFVVPNKQFITGQVLNWTLTNTTNRLVLNISAAYGSDPARVRGVLEEIVSAQPDVLADPQPLVTLERLGESSLEFTIRCFLAKLDRRLSVTHEILAEVTRRFRAEGIEIPFPQREVHLQTRTPAAAADGVPAP